MRELGELEDPVLGRVRAVERHLIARRAAQTDRPPGVLDRQLLGRDEGDDRARRVGVRRYEGEAGPRAPLDAGDELPVAGQQVAAVDDLGLPARDERVDDQAGAGVTHLFLEALVGEGQVPLMAGGEAVDPAERGRAAGEFAADLDEGQWVGLQPAHAARGGKPQQAGVEQRLDNGVRETAFGLGGPDVLPGELAEVSGASDQLRRAQLLDRDVGGSVGNGHELIFLLVRNLRRRSAAASRPRR